MLGPAGTGGGQSGGVRAEGRHPPPPPAPCCLPRALIITETGKPIYFNRPLQVHLTLFSPISLHSIPTILLLPLCPIFPQNTSHLGPVEGSSFLRCCCFARPALSPFPPQEGQGSPAAPGRAVSEGCPRGVSEAAPVSPRGAPRQRSTPGGEEKAGGPGGPPARQAGGGMAERVGGHLNITYGRWRYPFGGAEPLCAPPGVGGGPTLGTGVGEGWWWPRSRVGTHVLPVGSVTRRFALGRWAGEAPDV